MPRLPPTRAFLEVQLASLRERAAALDGAAKGEDATAKLAVVVEELGEAELLLRRDTRINREGAAVILAMMHRLLDAIE